MFRRCRILVLVVRVFLAGTIGANAGAPKLANPGRGFHRLHGHCRHICSPARTPLGAALRLPRHSRYRMGLSGAARQHSRHQFERHVHRIRRSPLGRRRFYRQSTVRPHRQGRLFRETRRTGPGHGRFRRFPRATTGTLSPAHFEAFRDATLGLTVYSTA
jgi:hypothetical protein